MLSQQKASSKNNILDEHLLFAKKILNEYTLCDFCLGRLFAKKMGVTSHQLLGKKIKKILHFKSTKNCSICKDILLNLPSIVERMLENHQNTIFLPL